MDVKSESDNDAGNDADVGNVDDDDDDDDDDGVGGGIGGVNGGGGDGDGGDGGCGDDGGGGGDTTITVLIWVEWNTGVVEGRGTPPCLVVESSSPAESELPSSQPPCRGCSSSAAQCSCPCRRSPEEPTTFSHKYVSGDRPLSTHADPTSTRRAIFHERRISSVTFTSAHLYGTINITTL